MEKMEAHEDVKLLSAHVSDSDPAFCSRVYLISETGNVDGFLPSQR